MSRISRKGEPRPKRSDRIPPRAEYPCDQAIILKKPRHYKIDFFYVLRRRASDSGFRPLSIDQLADFLGHALRTTDARREPSGLIWQHKAYPSAGGIHPIDTFILNFPPGSRSVYFYNSLGHTLKKLPDEYSRSLCLLRQNALKIRKEPHATFLWFAAQSHLTAAKYLHFESLLWRDAGCIITTAYLVAAALKLKCCTLGITGKDYFAPLARKGEQIEGIGGIMLGT
jgi:SagB-type dehydrogenase family enzyme